MNAGSAGPLSWQAQAWDAVIAREFEQLHGTDVYVQLVCRQLMGMMLLVYVRSSLAPNCSAARSVSVGTGLLGVLGNKGAVATSLQIHSTWICFLCAHLASGATNVDTRNADATFLLQKICFPPSGVDEAAPESILDHEVVVFFGDLNYRIELDGDVVRQAVADGDLDLLRKHDQLIGSQVLGLPPFDIMTLLTTFPPS